jgi:hypothetical protein
MHRRFHMETQHESRIGRALSEWNWRAIAAGVVIALAVQVLMLWLGNAFALSVGDKQPAGAFAVWVVIVQLGSLFIGSWFAAYIARSGSTSSGAAIGAFTWALALVLGSAVASRPLESWRPADAGAAAWTTFVGGLLSLAAAIAGGALGGRRARSHVKPYEHIVRPPPEPYARET